MGVLFHKMTTETTTKLSAMSTEYQDRFTLKCSFVCIYVFCSGCIQKTKASQYIKIHITITAIEKYKL